MIDHMRYRSLMLTAPHQPSADPRELEELLEHRATCTECALFTDRLLRFESRLQRAMQIDLPTRSNVLAFDSRAPQRPRRPALRWLALAASVVLGLVAATGIWLGAPGRSLAADVVAHMADEPGAWRRTDQPVPSPMLAAVLHDSKVRLLPNAGMVSYASSCPFRGHTVPHLVVQSAAGPVTVMLLVHEPVRKSMKFDSQGYRGTLVPIAGHGSLAVLMKDPNTDPGELAAIAGRVRDSIVYTP